MPLPRIFRLAKWVAAHPCVPVLVRAYFKVPEPETAAPAPQAYSSEEDVMGLARALGAGG